MTKKNDKKAPDGVIIEESKEHKGAAAHPKPEIITNTDTVAPQFAEVGPDLDPAESVEDLQVRENPVRDLAEAKAELSNLGDFIGVGVNECQAALDGASKYLLGFEMPAFNTVEKSSRVEVVQELIDRIKPGMESLASATRFLKSIVPDE